MAAKLKVGDEVVVITGRDKGKHGRILQIDRKRERVVVEGVMMMKHHNKAGRTHQGPTGGIETKHDEEDCGYPGGDARRGRGSRW